MDFKTNIEIPKSDFDKETLKHINNLYTYALLITGEESKAEKILLKTYAKAFWFYEYLSGETDIKIWLHRIIMNIFRDANLQSGNEPSDTDSITSLSKINYNLLEQRESFAFTNRLIKKISFLTFGMKEVLILKDILGFSLEVTADLIDIPEGTVRKRLFDARRTLFEIIEDDNPDPAISSPAHIKYEDKKIIASIADDASETEPAREDIQKFKDEIEAQQFIKAIINKHLPVQSVRDSVTLKIIKKHAQEFKDTFEAKAGSENKRMVLGATIIMIVLIILMIIFGNPNSVNPGDLATMQKGKNNAFLILKDNYVRYESSEFKEVIIQLKPDSLINSLADYSIGEKSFLSGFSEWNLAGLFFTEIKNERLPNFIYKNKMEETILSVQFPKISFKKERNLTLSDELFEYLLSGKCFSLRENDTIYLLRTYGEYIIGFAVKLQNKTIIQQLCNQKPE